MRWVGKIADWLFPLRVIARAEADELMEAYGDQAYFVARTLAREARLRGDRQTDRLYSRARREIAKRTDFPVGIDTATRLLETDVLDLVPPRNATLH